jgi:phosphoribosylanthranilate isomerase
MIRVKVCGLCNPVNVKDIGEAMPDFMGFIFFPGSPRYVGKEPDMVLFHNVPPMVRKIGVFVNEDNHNIIDISMRTGLDMVQLHGNESPVSCIQLKSSGLTIIKAFNIGYDFSFESLNQYMPACDFFLFDAKNELYGGSGRKFNWGILEDYTLDKPFFLGGGIGPEDTGVINSIVNRGFYAIDINSRFETSPAMKDAEMVKRFIKEIKNDRL